ncbi:MAG: hypothetical protein ACON4K_00245 [Akkermansiaceae bacterium]
MDSATKQERKVELSSRLATLRQALNASRSGLTRELQVSNVLKRSLRQNPIPWFVGSLGSATLLARLIRRPMISGKRRGPLGTLFGLGFSLVKPTLIKWGVERLKAEFEKHLGRNEQQGSQDPNSKLG